MSLKKSYDYTYYLVDELGRRAQFRDITGLDLERLEFFLRSEETKVILPNEKVSILELLLVKGINPSNWAARFVNVGFEVIFREIFEQEFMTKEQWLKSLYLIQDRSFSGLSEMEKQPMSKFVAMINIHSQLIEVKPDEQ